MLKFIYSSGGEIMCTAIKYKSNNNIYFGRNLDLNFSYQEKVIITPRNYPLVFRYLPTMENHFAIIGMGINIKNFPLYYDACNEHGLAIAGLNFPNNAYYSEMNEVTCHNKKICPFEFVLYLLSQYKSVLEVKEALKEITLINVDFNEKLHNSPLHFMISDKFNHSLVVEPMQDGLHIYDNTDVSVLANNPIYPKHLDNLKKYKQLTNNDANFTLAKEDFYYGVGLMGLPGDISSPSRFIRSYINLKYALSFADESSSVNQFFHLLDNVAMIKGLCQVKDGSYDYTVYSCCINLNQGIYYYKRYEENTLNKISLFDYDLNITDLYLL